MAATLPATQHHTALHGRPKQRIRAPHRNGTTPYHSNGGTAQSTIAPNFLPGLNVEVRPGVNHHQDLSAHHADGPPPLLVRVWVFPCCSQRVIKDIGHSLEVDAMRPKICPALGRVPSPTQVPPPLAILHNCSYDRSVQSIASR